MNNPSVTTAKISSSLKKYRIDRDLTQAELSKRAGMNSNAYAKIERGIRRANTDTLEKICKALDVHSSDILPF